MFHTCRCSCTAALGFSTPQSATCVFLCTLVSGCSLSCHAHTHSRLLAHRLQQVRSLWSEIPHIQKAVEKLSKECMDLLNRIFVVDDKKRITIEAIKEHPWSVKTSACTVMHYTAARQGSYAVRFFSKEARQPTPTILSHLGG